KYQVFVSSTFKDLKEERQEVIQALLELDCIPVGMEMFPAADDDQWTLIRRLIDDCDYYVLIVGGRYGSLNAEGVSYTQMEYEYALAKGIPIISFLHKEPDNIAIGKSETNEILIHKFAEFKKLVQQKMCKYYATPVELGSLVSRSLVKLTKDKPQPGWVRATFTPNAETANEILRLTRELETLKKELAATNMAGPEGIEDLSQGEDVVLITYEIKKTSKQHAPRYITKRLKAVVSWNELFAQVSPLMIDEASEYDIYNTLGQFILKKEASALKEDVQDERLVELKIIDSDFQTIKIQLRALNLITESLRKRGVHDQGKYWKLTPHGDTVMTRLRAIKKELKKDKD
ncbi:MAG TPA: DUF4062 domain-containing protein, partial [Chryseosolibacter sp.]